jgi:putative phosphoribosyl transferase
VIRFRDRVDAGRRLAEALQAEYSGREDAVVLGLPRGGVVVAAEISNDLGLPLDMVGVRKLGAPMQPELAIGAIAEDGVVLVDEALVDHLKVPQEYVEREISRQRQVLEERARLYRGEREPILLQGKVCILVDDGLATGSTAAAAAESVRRKEPARVVFAVPVASDQGYIRVRSRADKVVCPQVVRDMGAVGYYYERFDPVEDEEVIRLLAG